MGTSTCKSCGKPIHWIRPRFGRSMPCDTRPVNYHIKPGGSTKLITPAGDVISCEIADNPAESSGPGLHTTLEHLQRARVVQKEVIMVKNGKRHKRQPPSLWKRQTCDTCVSRKKCDDFFERAYARIGMKEPERWRKWACKMHKERRPGV